MFKKLITIFLTLSILTFLNISTSARTIRYGSRLALETNHEPFSKYGWTVFYYLVFSSSKSDSAREHVAATPYCNNGYVNHNFDFEPSTVPIPEWATPEQLEEIGQLSAYTTKRTSFREDKSELPKWVTLVNGKPFIVTADSEASKALIEVVCRIAS